ncbi:MAG: glycoside hydrolase family 88 protein [Clostridiales bacterium]
MYNLLDKYIEKLLKESTPKRPIWNIEYLDKLKEVKWNYIDGCMMTALIELGNITKNEKYIDFVENFIDYYVFEDGTIRGYKVEEYNLDNVNEGKVLFTLYKITKKSKYKKAIELIYSQLENHPRIEGGNFWHKKIYPNQVWLDGIYMAQPFYLKYELEFNNLKNYDDIFNQIKNVKDKMYDKQKQLYYHGYDHSKSMFWADKEKGVSKNFWLRATGWYTVALADILEMILDKGSDKYKSISDQFIETIDGLLKYQDVSGMWYQVIDKTDIKDNYLETSGTAMIAYAILKGVRLGILSEKYLVIGKKAFDGICNKYLTNRNGDLNLGGICLVAGLGPENNKRRDGSIKYYLSEPIVENDAKGVGPLLLAYTEIRRL